MRVFNFGSINIDHVYRVPHIVQPGETIAGKSYNVFAGGKGANQSVALARAGAAVMHVGHVGREAGWVLEKLRGSGVDTSLIKISDTPTGHAIIQVDDAAQNSIVLFAGANHLLTPEATGPALAAAVGGDVMLLQNETNGVGELIRAGAARGMAVVLNPAPFTPEVLALPLELLDTLIVNEHEAHGVAGVEGEASPDVLIASLARKLPTVRIVLTLGERGVICRSGTSSVAVAAQRVQAVDTTAAGDTFIGYYLAGRLKKLRTREALALATRAAAICVSRVGAMDSIPMMSEVPA